MTVEVRKQTASDIFDKVGNLMESLLCRWLDERGYEDINDYAAPINAVLAPYGTAVQKMSKRPFGFFYQLSDATYFVSITAGGRYAYKRIA